MKIELQESAIKELKKLDKADAKKILQKIKDLENYPDITNIKKLTNHYPPLRYRIGNYRVLFEILDDMIIIVHIRHSKEAY